MLDAIKNFFVKCPILNILFLVFCNGLFVKQFIKIHCKENKLDEEQIRNILKELPMKGEKLTDKEIDYYLCKEQKKNL